jgi:TonB family protein
MTSRKLDSDSEALKGRELLNDWLLRHAARKAPADLAARLEEEWRADMSGRTSFLSRLRFALGCCWAIQVIAYEHRPSAATATATTGGNALLAFAESHDASFYSRRGSSFVVVLALHLAVFYALFTWVTHIHVPAAVQALVPTFIKHDPPRDPPKPTPPNLSQITHTLDLPPIEFPPIDPGVQEVTTQVLRDPTIVEKLPPSPHVVTRVMGGIRAGFPNVEEFYPPPEIRLSHQGAVTVTVCVNPDGKLSSKPTLATGSGFDRLDQAAVTLAQAGSGHYRATTEDGQPVSSCYPLRIRFQLRN